jgi:hypothetical protein
MSPPTMFRSRSISSGDLICRATIDERKFGAWASMASMIASAAASFSSSQDLPPGSSRWKCWQNRLATWPPGGVSVSSWVLGICREMIGLRVQPVSLASR